MIKDVLTLLKDKLNAYFKDITHSETNQVTFLDGSKMDPLALPHNSVVPILVNVDEETIIRQANRQGETFQNGIKTGASPAIGVNILVLFVSSFTDYEQSLEFLSLVIYYFQKCSFLDRVNTPALPADVEKITIELISLPIAQRNELWTSLKTTYRPSVTYKIGVLMFNDNSKLITPPQIIKDKIEVKTNIINKVNYEHNDISKIIS